MYTHTSSGTYVLTFNSSNGSVGVCVFIDISVSKSIKCLWLRASKIESSKCAIVLTSEPLKKIIILRFCGVCVSGSNFGYGRLHTGFLCRIFHDSFSFPIYDMLDPKWNAKKVIVKQNECHYNIPDFPLQCFRFN